MVNSPSLRFGDITVSVEEALVQATSFMLSYCGRPECTSLTDALQKIWLRKISQSIGAAPNLQNLPPTNEAFAENVARAHPEIATWTHAIHLNPHNMGPLTHMGGQDVTVLHLWLLLLFLTTRLLLLITY